MFDPAISEKVKNGNTEAMFKLAVCFWKGKHVKKSQKHAIIWFRKAAMAGHPDAQFNLALCYFDGKKGLEKNEKRALYWFSKAANKNNVNAQYLLGVIYDVKKNEEFMVFNPEKICIGGGFTYFEDILYQRLLEKLLI